ncbi:hypothetical protein [Planctomyces sp. SH-PL62]|uniref:hypothetical protein n=1 Tax=Planctomyces sp. SH-PL62 TaxID=1636152 RepID=UPI00078C3162|nr:hypothetical protein [Planctomyces sp. SH-PL62]AMV36450.1 hypothetical protein VT85_03395 [Planctomyces sp. SH-PL62]
MSIDDYNRGYQAGATGWYTGPPRSAAEMVGRWNAEADRQRWQQSASSGPPGPSGGGGDSIGGPVWAGLIGALAGGLASQSWIAAIASGVAAGFAWPLVVIALIGLLRALAWVFGGLPKMKLVTSGASCGLTVWVLLEGFAHGQTVLGPVGAAVGGAVAALGLGMAACVLLVPFRALARLR